MLRFENPSGLDPSDWVMVSHPLEWIKTFKNLWYCISSLPLDGWFNLLVFCPKWKATTTGKILIADYQNINIYQWLTMIQTLLGRDEYPFASQVGVRWGTRILTYSCPKLMIRIRMNSFCEVAGNHQPVECEHGLRKLVMIHMVLEFSIYSDAEAGEARWFAKTNTFAGLHVQSAGCIGCMTDQLMVFGGVMFKIDFTFIFHDLSISFYQESFSWMEWWTP